MGERNSKAQWWQKSVVYQVYPRSFQDSNHDGMGDLNGITSRLDYIKDLGVDVIWLNPVYASPGVDNGYDISDYQAINPELGSMADFERLLAKAHQLGLKIMMDLVVNHTSDQHNWFVESRKSTENAHRDYYIWRDPVDGHAPNNWGAAFSGPAWTYDEATKQYYLHLFAPEQPDLNWENSEMRQSVYDMMNWWSDRGVDGFRMDVISLISKPAGLPDGPKSEGAMYGNSGLVSNGPHVHEYLKEMNQQVMKKQDLITVGETPGVDIENALKYSNLNNDELNMVFQFEHMGLDSNTNPALGKWDSRKTNLVDLKNNLTKWQVGLYGKAWNSLYWNNHDQPRAVSRFGDDSEAYRVRSAKMLALVLHMLQGTPYIYEGEELGMTNANFNSLSDYRDLESINAYHELVDDEQLVDGDTMLAYLRVHSRDNARTPMQWSTEANGGFSDHEPWLAANPNYKEINAAAELNDDHSVLAFYKELIRLRHTLDVITDGRYEQVPGTEQNESVYAYTRTNAQQSLLVVANYTDQIIQTEVTPNSNSNLLISNYDDDRGSELRPFEAKVYSSIIG